MEVAVEYRFYQNGYDLFLFEKQSDWTTIAFPITFGKVTSAELFAPCVFLKKEVAHQLMDELWRAGVRPTEVGSPGQLKAVENHLQDMRKLTFELLKGYIKDPSNV